MPAPDPPPDSTPADTDRPIARPARVSTDEALAPCEAIGDLGGESPCFAHLFEDPLEPPD